MYPRDQVPILRDLGSNSFSLLSLFNFLPPFLLAEVGIDGQDSDTLAD